MTEQNQALSAADRAFIREAAHFFENPSKVMQGLNWLGAKIEKTQKLLPKKMQDQISEKTQLAVEKAMTVAIKSLKKEQAGGSFHERLLQSEQGKRLHISAAAVSGAIGGIFGLTSTLLELPVITVILLRGIGDVAQKMGFDPDDPEVMLQCMYVFSLGAKSEKDDTLNSSYYASRLAFAQSIRQASGFIARSSLSEILKGLRGGSAGVLSVLVRKVAERFEVRVTEKVIAGGAPLAGAIGGSVINSVFADYYQSCARYHFGLSRLEKEKGEELVRREFEAERKRATTEFAGAASG